MNFTEKESAVLDDALKTWGLEEQKAMAIGEIGEFLLLFGRVAQGRDTPEEWHSEIADVQIMMEQMAKIHGYEAVAKCKAEKMERLAKRLNDAHVAEAIKYGMTPVGSEPIPEKKTFKDDGDGVAEAFVASLLLGTRKSEPLPEPLPIPEIKTEAEYLEMFPDGTPVRVYKDKRDVGFYGFITGRNGGVVTITTPHGSVVNSGYAWVHRIQGVDEVNKMREFMDAARQDGKTPPYDY